MATVPESIHPTGKILGSGSYGEVIEVEWCSTICAAKRIHDIFTTISKAELDKMVKDFEKECQIWSSLRHPNIVQLLGNYYPSDSQELYCVMEKMDTSLRHYLEGHCREIFLLPDKVSVLRQVAQGLCYLHSQNPPLVHHDLSPNNILLNEQTFQTKLTDFGMTRAINLSKLTRKSSVKGTFAFMSPEALDVPPRYTEKLDVFSFGNCMITTLTHEWPNPSHPTTYGQGKMIVRTEFERRIHQIDQMSSREKDLFLPLVRRCLEGDATIRPSSAELVSAMKQIESTLQSTEPSKIIQAQQIIEAKNIETAELRILLTQKNEINRDLHNNLEEQRDHFQQWLEEHLHQLALLCETVKSQKISASLQDDSIHLKGDGLDKGNPQFNVQQPIQLSQLRETEVRLRAVMDILQNEIAQLIGNKKKLETELRSDIQAQQKEMELFKSEMETLKMEIAPIISIKSPTKTVKQPENQPSLVPPVYPDSIQSQDSSHPTQVDTDINKQVAALVMEVDDLTSKVETQERALGNLPSLLTFETEENISNKDKYAYYVSKNLRKGMFVRACKDYEAIKQGDVGIFVQSNKLNPPAEFKWLLYGKKYWIHWDCVEILPWPVQSHPPLPPNVPVKHKSTTERSLSLGSR